MPREPTQSHTKPHCHSKAPSPERPVSYSLWESPHSEPPKSVRFLQVSLLCDLMRSCSNMQGCAEARGTLCTQLGLFMLRMKGCRGRGSPYPRPGDEQRRPAGGAAPPREGDRRGPVVGFHLPLGQFAVLMHSSHGHLASGQGCPPGCPL